MDDRKTIRWPDDSTRVNIQADQELQFWARLLRVSRAKLIQAVSAVGTRYRDVSRHLDERRHPT